MKIGNTPPSYIAGFKFESPYIAYSCHNKKGSYKASAKTHLLPLKLFAALVLILLPMILFAQQGTSGPAKYALVIGNGAYTGLARLTNPVNDANDMSAALEELGFTVDKILNGSLDQMEAAIMRLKNRLSVSSSSYGFFFYAGHGVQSGGENYLIPADANIPGENFLRNRAVAVQSMLDELNDAGNELNVVVLDACRDNPFGWSRSGSRGLSIVSRQPADSIIVYATSAGQRASDGEGRNGLFTQELLVNIRIPGLEVSEVFKRTGADVAEVSNRQQVPAIYNQFFGTAYLGITPSGEQTQITIIRPAPQPSQTEKNRTGNPESRLWSIGASVGTSFADPWVIGTVHGTIAPFNYTFLELGLDLGLISTVENTKYFSLYPFAHLAFFWPFTSKIGWYAGAGGGHLIAKYTIDNLKIPKNIFAADFTTGVLLFNSLNLSYTMRTNFSSASNKLAVGYSYRF